ncbi:MAG: hypothetical protein M3032_06205 [Verrucomicrobiota bacterium]|nr:hypothetical protein [Verrucomicrobiota bacterium]
MNSANSLGASSGAVTINDATLEAAASFATTRNIVLGNNTSTIQVNSGAAYSWAE